jgi:hypothetical protein
MALSFTPKSNQEAGPIYPPLSTKSQPSSTLTLSHQKKKKLQNRQRTTKLHPKKRLMNFLNRTIRKRPATRIKAKDSPSLTTSNYTGLNIKIPTKIG